jgi:hypothetical protein
MPRKKKPKQRRRGRSGLLVRLSISQITDEIARRQRVLLGRRTAIESELESVNAEIAQLGSVNGGSPRRGPGRPRGKGVAAQSSGESGHQRRGRGGSERSLSTLLHSLLRGKTMSVPEMADAAKKAGHKSKSKNFRTIVSLALISHRNMFQRVSRGQYTAK